MVEGAPEDWVYKPPPLNSEDGATSGAKAGKDYRLNEWWPVRRMRPLPPQPPVEWSGALSPGDEANVFVEDGWWDVVVLDKNDHEEVPDGCFVVEYEHAKKVHIVPPERLRPLWCWHKGEWISWSAWHQSRDETEVGEWPAHGDHAWILPPPSPTKPSSGLVANSKLAKPTWDAPSTARPPSQMRPVSIKTKASWLDDLDDSRPPKKQNRGPPNRGSIM